MAFVERSVRAVLRELGLDVADLVQLATMDDGVVEDGAHRAREGLRAVDDDEDRRPHVEAALAKIDEQVLHHRRVLGVALDERERVLLARDVDSPRHDPDVVGEVDASIMRATRSRSSRRVASSSPSACSVA